MKARTAACVFGAMAIAAVSAAERRLSIEDFRDRAEAAWLGQIAGVAWGAPTEFRYQGAIIPEEKTPAWKPALINDAFDQDDLYVEMTFLRTLEQYGLDVDIRRAGIDFANSQYKLWCANEAGRRNLRMGIAPPDSGHPKFNTRGNDIDYQIEADYSGIISPGLPNSVIALADKFGRLMNYGDGVLGGIFVAAMYAEAYFCNNVDGLLDAGLAAIPAESDYAEMVRQIRAWHKENPSDWQWCWKKIEEKYHPDGKKWTWKDTNGGIDARINGAQIVLGLLYGNGDLDKTIIISMRGGYDSDCNPSSAAGPLFAVFGKSKLPGKFKDELTRNVKFSFTEYDFDGLMAVTEKLMRKIVVKEGGRIEKDAAGKEWIVIPAAAKINVPKYVPTWTPEPPMLSKYSAEEMKLQKFAAPEFDEEKIRSMDPTVRVQEVLDKMFPGWKTTVNGPDMNPGFNPNYDHSSMVLVTHPPARGVPVTLSKRMKVPTGDPRLVIQVANAHNGDFDAAVRIDGEKVLTFNVGVPGRILWQNIELSLNAWAGKEVLVEVDHIPSGWMCEAAYWRRLEMKANNQ